MKQLEIQRVARIALDQANDQPQVTSTPPRSRSGVLWAICASTIVALASTAVAFPEYLV